MSAKRKIAAAVAIGTLFLTANEASAQHQTNSHTVGICNAHSNGHMDTFHAKCRNVVPPVMYTVLIRLDASHSQIRIEILASKILGHTRRANSIVSALAKVEGPCRLPSCRRCPPPPNRARVLCVCGLHR